MAVFGPFGTQGVEWKVSYQDFGSHDQDFGSQDFGILSGETSEADLIYRCMHDTCIVFDIYSFIQYVTMFGNSQIIIRNVNIRTITFGHLPSYLHRCLKI